MISFEPMDLARKQEFDKILMNCGDRGCEYSFANLFLWGRQRAAVIDGFLVFFNQYDRQSVYMYPVGTGDVRPVLDAILHDAATRDIACRLVCMNREDCIQLTTLYPDMFHIHCDRNGFDYVYKIDDLADLKGRKYQKKRNHIHKFRAEYPDCHVEVLEEKHIPAVREMVEEWYRERLEENPYGDFHMEQVAMDRALRCWKELGMEGILLMNGDEILAMTMGTPLSETNFDVNFEKAKANAEGAYAVINQEFARYLRNKYPALQFLNREDDMGLEGLRKAKESYCPDHMVEQYWACLMEDSCGE